MEEEKQFPVEGKTDYNESIYQYLKDNGRSIYDGQQYNPNKHEAIAWNDSNIWGISSSSAGSKPYFSRAFLLDFISTFPEKWCILYSKLKNNQEEKKVNDYFNKVLGRVPGGTGYFHYPEVREGVCSKSLKENGYTEITFEQFEKNILKEFKPQFVKGKWYKNLGSDREYIAKFDELRGNNFWVTEYIDDCKKYYDSKGTIDYDHVTECSFEEIQQYLPDGHVDKIKTIPQYVKCIGLSEKEVGSWSDNYEIGKIYKTAGKSVSGNYNVFFDEFAWLICDKTQFIPSTKEEFEAQNHPKEVTPEYKVGDWVLVKGGGNGLNYKEEKIVRLIEKPYSATGHENPDYYFTIEDKNLGTSKDYIVRKATTTEIYIADDTLSHKNFEKTINGKTFWCEPVIQKAKKKDPLSYSAPVKTKNKNKLFKF